MKDYNAQQEGFIHNLGKKPPGPLPKPPPSIRKQVKHAAKVLRPIPTPSPHAFLDRRRALLRSAPGPGSIGAGPWFTSARSTSGPVTPVHIGPLASFPHRQHLL